MHYYYVFVAAESYRSNEPLTYASPERLKLGTIVHVPLRKETAVGFIVAAAPSPSFATKGILSAYYDHIIPTALRKLHSWMLTYYPAPSGMTTSLFLPSKPPSTPPPTEHAPAYKPTTSSLPPLKPDQTKSLSKIQYDGLHILFGQTGSGKTRVYIELALRAWEQNKSAIILVPEISLTAQTVATFTSVFGNAVLTYHSKLTPAQRRSLWGRIHTATTPLIIIGPRSALFAPLQNVGLIAVDEEHESSYKQEQAPHYQTLRVAARLAQIHKAILVAGSATPSVENYYLASQKSRPILDMQKHSQDTVEKVVVDLKDKASFTKNPILSNQLIKSIRQRLEANEQILLFLNRRGTARIVLCDQCGWQALCPHCDTPLTYHADEHVLRCHICGLKQQAAHSCPECGNSSITFSAIGTKAIEKAAHTLFPGAAIQRFDTDNKATERLERHYDAVRRGNVDIIIGTQMLVKGLDLPNLALVGIIAADTGLYVPDYTAEERTFQLIMQAIGRVGRGHGNGQVILQTYQPESFVIKAALREDWLAFYEKELVNREQFLFPPFCHLLKLTCKRKTQSGSEKAAQALADKLQGNPRITINGPAPSFHEKQGGYYRWQLTIKSKQRSELLDIIANLPSGWAYDIDPSHIL